MKMNSGRWDDGIDSGSQSDDTTTVRPVAAPKGFRWSQVTMDLWSVVTPAAFDDLAATTTAHLLECLPSLLPPFTHDPLVHPTTITVDFSSLPSDVQNVAADHPDTFFSSLDFSLFQIVHAGTINKDPAVLWQPWVSGRVDPLSCNVSLPVHPVHEHRLTSQQGVVVRVLRPVGRLTEVGYHCRSCQKFQRCMYHKGCLQTPPPYCGCGAGDLIPAGANGFTEEQTVVVRLFPSKVSHDAIPVFVEVHLRGGLVNTVAAGCAVNVLGVVRTQTVAVSGNDVGQHSAYLEAKSVSPLPNGIPRIAEKRVAAVRQLFEDKKETMFRILVNSICPELIGQEGVKAAVLLSLLGAPRRANGGVVFPGSINVLVVGEPAVGKSMLLRKAARASPRGMYLDGAAAKVRHELAPRCSDGSLEAGALGMCSSGHLVVDNLGAAPSVHRLLVEALESRRLPVMDAGAVLCDFSMIGSVSPPHGAFAKGSGLAANLPPRFSQRLLRQFDFVVLMLDTREVDADEEVSAALMEMYKNGVEGLRARVKGEKKLRVDEGDGAPLLQRLRLDDTDSFEPLPPGLLRQALNVARRVVPHISPQAATALFEMHAALLRADGAEAPDLGRSFCTAMVKLSQARARAELSPVVTEAHVLDVVELVLEARYELAGSCVVAPEHGRKGIQKNAHRLLKCLQTLAAKRGTDTFTTDELQGGICQSLQLTPFDLPPLVRKLNDEGVLIKTHSGTYRLLNPSNDIF